MNEDDARAAAAAANRKRALADWEEKKKRWRSMGVPPATKRSTFMAVSRWMMLTLSRSLAARLRRSAGT